jgi:hypothetical protein
MCPPLTTSTSTTSSSSHYDHHPAAGEDEESVESSSATLVQSEEGFQPVFFDPRPLKNLVLIDEQTSLMPVTDMQVRGGWLAGWLGEECCGCAPAPLVCCCM